MKNMKVSLKLFTSFSIITFLCVLIGVLGIIGMNKISSEGNDMYTVQTKPLPDLAKTLEYIQRLRIQLRNASLATGNLERLKTIEADIIDRKQKFVGFAESYSNNIATQKGHELYNEAMDAYYNVFVPAIDETLQGAKNGENQEILITIMDAAGPATNLIVDNFTECMDIRVSMAEQANEDNMATYKRLLFIIIIAMIVAVTISVFFSLYISGLISKPLSVLTSFMSRAGLTGDIFFNKDETENINKYSDTKDEVGTCIRSASVFMKHITEIAGDLDYIANGDLSVNVHCLSGEDVMGVALQKTIDKLNHMFSEINLSTEQVAFSSKQISEGAQTLAQGSTEQASAVSQLSDSLSEIAKKTNENAGKAGEAATLAKTIMNNAEKGSRQMNEMMSAVKEINLASHNISNVIKVIDDIAFQTNILALNAAVEAARAGQHGKGFAIVAEEVRNLASKSAEAAKNTGELITSSIEKAGLGARIADETSASLTEIVDGITESNQIVSEIASSSEEQSSGILQLKKGIELVSQVVHQNSATAEESAAASEEMSGQAQILEELISQFKLNDEIKRANFNNLPNVGAINNNQLLLTSKQI